MYTIIKKLDGTFACQFRLQDGTEYYTESTIKAAIAHAIRFAKVMNGTKITKGAISFYEERQVQNIDLVPWKP